MRTSRSPIESEPVGRAVLLPRLACKRRLHRGSAGGSRVAARAQVTDFEITDWLRKKINASAEELVKERDCVGHLIPGSSFAACMITEDTTLPGEV